MAAELRPMASQPERASLDDGLSRLGHLQRIPASLLSDCDPSKEEREGDMMLSVEDIDREMSRIPVSDVPHLIGFLGTLMAKAQLRMIQPDAVPLSPPDAGQYLSVEEVAARFHVSKVWLYRHKRKLPHSQPSRKVLLFPERAISQWFANRKGA
jgi:hypothetical protein